MPKLKAWSFKTTLLLLCSGVLLIAGGLLLLKPSLITSFLNQPAALDFQQSAESSEKVSGHFATQALQRFQFRAEQQDLFSLLVAHYQDKAQKSHRAILFPADANENSVLVSPTGLRHKLWLEAASAISNNAAKEAIILSWWDDGQRVHFLSGLNAWITKPAAPTFEGGVWQALKPQLILASDEEAQGLTKMAKWLSMDCDKALADIAAQFGSKQPIYLIVTSDLLLRQGELMAYGASPLSFHRHNLPVGADLHADIAQVKRWAAETGEGNYLVQKEGQYYRTWSPENPATNNTLLVRLLPFMNSLQQLPKGVKLVYQSGAGAFISVYQLLQQ